ncbi:MAG: hypothetical protein WAZ40_01230 [Minisyncoccia bacterium]
MKIIKVVLLIFLGIITVGVAGDWFRFFVVDGYYKKLSTVLLVVYSFVFPGVLLLILWLGRGIWNLK